MNSRSVGAGVPYSVLWLGYVFHGSGFDSRNGHKIFLSSKLFSPAVESTKRPVQWMRVSEWESGRSAVQTLVGAAVNLPSL
jgi:hypothetical protein